MENTKLETQVKQPKQNNFIIILLSILLLISVFIAGFFAFQTQKLVKELQIIRSNSVAVQSPISAPTPDPTANWKTYTNTEYSFKYPREWSIPKEETLQSSQQISFDNILTVTSRRSLTFEQFVAENLPTDKTLPVDYINGDIHGKKLIYKSGVDQATIDTVIAFPGQTQNVITFLYTDSPGHITKSEIIDQILSTFKFINEPSKCLTVEDPCNPQACNYDQSKCNN